MSVYSPFYSLFVYSLFFEKLFLDISQKIQKTYKGQNLINDVEAAQ